MSRSYDDLRRRVRDTRQWLQRIRRMMIEKGFVTVETSELVEKTPDSQVEVEDDDESGMTEAEINAKHFRIRGSMDLKYPPRDQACCAPCGFKDRHAAGELSRDHLCVLERGHKTECKFSSECVAHAR